MRTALILSAALFAAACGSNDAQTDDATLDAIAQDAAEPDFELAAPEPAEMATSGLACPQERWLDLEDYADTGLPAETDAVAFLEANGERGDVTTTASGLQYRVVQEGLKDGATPAPNEPVTVHYHGYFPDGNVFDSSYQRGQTIDFAPNQVIAGWTEALTDMRVCEARTLYVPGELAYGSRGRPGIPPNAMLLFNVQMLGVDRRG